MNLYSIGEMVIDFIPGEESNSYIRNAGGAPANIAIALAKNGLTAGFCGKLGNDDFGKFLVHTLNENNVKVLCPELTDQAITTMAFVSLNKSGERSFTFARKPGADMLLSIDDINVKDIRNSTIIHAGSCSLSKGTAIEATKYALKYAHEVGKIVSFDINYRDLMWDQNMDAASKAVFEILPYVDLLKISEEETAMIGGEDNIKEIMNDFNIKVIIETLGEQGAQCFFENNQFNIEGKKASAVDTTGAGDAFWGGFLSSLLLKNVENLSDLNEDKLKNAIEFGNIAGWLCVQKKGAIPSLPTIQEIQSFL